MKTLALCLSIWLAIASCGGEASTGAAQSGSQNIPTNTNKQFNNLINEFQQQISNKFWTDVTTFDMDAYSAYVQQKGLHKVPNSLMDYTGEIHGVSIIIAHKTTSGDNGGWMQQFTIYLTKDGFSQTKQFSVTR